MMMHLLKKFKNLELHNLKHLIPQQFRTNTGKRGRQPNNYRGHYKRQKSSNR